MSQTQTDELPPEHKLVQAGFRYALSLTHQKQDAEDLVQQAWLNLSKRYGKVENQAILYTTIRNQFYDICRRSRIVAFESMEESTEQSEPQKTENPAAKSDLDQLLGTLTSREREAIYLNCVEGYTAREISDQTVEPRGTILSLIARGKKKLHDLVQFEATMSSHE